MRDFFVRETADQRPFRCVCGSQAGPIVDTYLDVDGYGRVFLCEHCVSRSASSLGWRSPSTALEQEEDIHRLKAHVADLEEQLERERDPMSKTITAREMLTLIAAQEQLT